MTFLHLPVSQQLSIHLFLRCCSALSPSTAGTTAGTGRGHPDRVAQVAGGKGLEARIPRAFGTHTTRKRKGSVGSGGLIRLHLLLLTHPSFCNLLMHSQTNSLGAAQAGEPLTWNKPTQHTKSRRDPYMQHYDALMQSSGSATWRGCRGEGVE